MKNIYSLLLLVVCSYCATAQTPSAFSYQAVARNVNGEILANHSIAIKISILDSTASGNSVYVETHNVTTTPLGLFTLAIGKGNTLSGVFSSINWSANSKFFTTVRLLLKENQLITRFVI